MNTYHDRQFIPFMSALGGGYIEIQTFKFVKTKRLMDYDIIEPFHRNAVHSILNPRNGIGLGA